mgnify:CR=1 FL=1
MYETMPSQEEVPAGCLSGLGWLGAGFVLPCVSPTFYYRVARRGAFSAIVFLFLFTSAITGLLTARAVRGLVGASAQIQDAFESGAFPEITIVRGVAVVRAEQPVVLFDGQGMLIAIDTTGVYTQIDKAEYEQGLLLTRRELHVLSSDGQYQKLPLSALHELFSTDPIVIDQASVLSVWGTVSAVVAGVVFCIFGVWHGLVRFLYLLGLALLVWGVVALVRPDPGYRPVFVTGVYAVVPAVYLNYLVSRLGVGFVGLGTLLLLPMWALALVAAVAERKGGLLRGERRARLWRALIGLPFLVTMGLDVIFSWPDGAILVWGLAVVTFLVLQAVGLWTAGGAQPSAPLGRSASP